MEWDSIHVVLIMSPIVVKSDQATHYGIWWPHHPLFLYSNVQKRNPTAHYVQITPRYIDDGHHINVHENTLKSKTLRKP